MSRASSQRKSVKPLAEKRRSRSFVPRRWLRGASRRRRPCRRSLPGHRPTSSPVRRPLWPGYTTLVRSVSTDRRLQERLSPPARPPL
ncbi:MAG: hypothetical protein MZV63_63220 [Marinilabiliales bacterium]|nr:hypothetical protein [Marinilabiliales bacterium]